MEWSMRRRSIRFIASRSYWLTNFSHMSRNAAPFGLKVGRASRRHANYEISHVSPYTEFIYRSCRIWSSTFFWKVSTCANSPSIFAIWLMLHMETTNRWDYILKYNLLVHYVCMWFYFSFISFIYMFSTILHICYFDILKLLSIYNSK